MGMTRYERTPNRSAPNRALFWQLIFPIICHWINFMESSCLQLLVIGSAVVSHVAVVLWPMCCHTEMTFRRHRTWHPPATKYSHGANMSLCYPLVWNTLGHTTSHFNVVGQIRSGHPSPTFHTHQLANAQLYDAGMVVISQKLCWKCPVPTGSWTLDLWCANPLTHSFISSLYVLNIWLPKTGFLIRQRTIN